jgi:hypothetical protein
MSSFYRGMSIHASYEISVHLGKRFQRRIFFRNQPIRKRMACGGQLLVNGLKLKEQSLYRGPSKDVPYQVLIHLAKWFQIKKN